MAQILNFLEKELDKNKELRILLKLVYFLVRFKVTFFRQNWCW